MIYFWIRCWYWRFNNCFCRGRSKIKQDAPNFNKEMNMSPTHTKIMSLVFFILFLLTNKNQNWFCFNLMSSVYEINDLAKQKLSNSTPPLNLILITMHIVFWGRAGVMSRIDKYGKRRTNERSVVFRCNVSLSSLLLKITLY